MATPSKPQQRGQDPVKVDSKHYTLEFENEKIRVLRIKYGPGEKSVMHAHPDGLLVALTSFRGTFVFPDGRKEERTAEAGETLWMAGEEHLPENTGSEALELILVELKS